jgi:hypothetical protein
MYLEQELLKEMQESIDKVNHLMCNDELTGFTKQKLLHDEFQKQRNIAQMREEWINQ